jgi:glutamate--cysteine ligase
MQSTPLTKEVCRNYIEEHLLGPPIQHGNLLQHQVGSIGLELEAFAYKFTDEKKIQPARLYGGTGSLADALVSVSKLHGGQVRYLDKISDNENHEPLIAAIHFRDGCNFNFEPGAQVEISTAPCDSIAKLTMQLTGMQKILQQLTVNDSFHFTQVGTHPLFTVDAIGMQMNKARYRAMARYFDNIGPFGIMMMMQTCSLQVNMDTGTDWHTRAKRITAANLLAPFATALFANSPVTAGKVNGHQSYRSYIWQQLDTARTGIWLSDQLTGTFDKDALVDAYLNFALMAPVICIEDFGDELLPPQVTMNYWMAHPVKGLLPSLAHFKNHLTLLFPEVRLKGYLELRSVDAPPPQWQLVPALFYSGLLYNDSCLNKVLDLLLPLTTQLPQLMQEATYGLKSDRLYQLARQLMQLAIDGFSLLPLTFTGDVIQQLISFTQNFTLHRKTFADDMLERFQAGKILFF